MGIIGKRDKAKNATPGTTVISDGTRIVGELTLESNLHLDGQIKGTIISDHDVSVGRSGRFEGNLKAERLLVSGFVEGVIDCACMEIVANGRVFGELHSDDFIIEPGGNFLGESHPRRDTSMAELRHERSHEPQLSGPASESSGPAQRAPSESSAPPGNAPFQDQQGGAQESGRSGPEPRTAGQEEGTGPGNEPGDEAVGEEGQTVHREPRRTTWGRR